ncbi:MAG: MarR family winged helix-turn-helix transcriptional regulator [Pikeienuella sp.]
MYHLHDSLGYRLTYAARLNERRFEVRLTALGLTRLMWCVLCALEYEALHRPSEIAKFIGVDRTAISRCLKLMEARGLIARRAAKGDARARDVSATDAGREVLAPATEAARENAAFWHEKLTAGDRIALLRALDSLTEQDDEPLMGI